MKLRLHRNVSLKTLLLICFISIAVLPAILISSYFYYSVTSSLEQNTVRTSHLMLQSAADKIDARIDQINEFSNWLCNDKIILDLLGQQSASAYPPALQQAIKSLDEQFQYRPLTEYILSLAILGEATDVRRGPEASLADGAQFKQLTAELLEQHGAETIYWGPIMQNITRLTEYEEIIPYCRKITDAHGNPLGQLVLLLNPAIFADECSSLEIVENAGYAVLHENGMVMARSHALKNRSTLPARSAGAIRPSFLPADFDKQGLTIQEQTRKSGWLILQTLPSSYLGQQRRPVVQAVLLLLLLSICSIFSLSYLLTRRLTKPVSNIVDAVCSIAAGNLDCAIPTAPGELGIISHSVDLMRNNLRLVMQRNVDREKEKRHTELRMLQQQINPHFLNNTLHSIKMMATMQGSRGIMNMIDALAAMLKGNLSARGDYFPLDHELSVLQGYLYIQNIRFRDNIHFHFEIDDQASQCLIPKLILQPIVENAIVHGIESSNQGGNITLRASLKEDMLSISVRDDGCGMTEAQLQQVQASLSHYPAHEQEHGIGMRNVHSRIQMLYGENYGLHVTSAPGQGTCVSLHIPAKMKEAEKDDEISRDDC